MAAVRCCICRKEREEYAVSRLGESVVCRDCEPLVPESAGTPADVYSGFWTRAGAKLVDCVVLWAAAYVFGLLSELQGEAAETVFVGIMPVLLWICYSVSFVGSYGATPGKMAFGIKVVRPDGETIGYWRAFGRFWAECFSLIIFCVGYMMAAPDKEKRALHDRICDTRVVRA